MKTLVLLLFSVMAFASNPTVASTSQSETPKTQTLVIIGDSLTEGYGVKNEESFPYLLQLKVKSENKNWTIVNQGVTGSTSASAVSRVKWVLKKPPQIVILALGANDGLRGTSPQATESSLDQAIVLLKNAGVKVILGGMQMPPNYTGKYGKEFAEVFPKLAKKHHIKLIPFLLEGVGGVPELNLKDGIHPNAKGHAIISEMVYKFIQTEL